MRTNVLTLNTKVIKGPSENKCCFRIMEVSLVLFIMLANMCFIPSVKPHEWGSSGKEKKIVLYYMEIISFLEK